jgi:hypothetical protein
MKTSDIEVEAERLQKIISDPVRLAAYCAQIKPTPVTEALDKCESQAERLFLISQLHGVESAALLMRFDRNDAKSLREVAAGFDKADLVELAAAAREAAKVAKLKEPPWQTANRRQRRARQKKFRAALAKAKKTA